MTGMSARDPGECRELTLKRQSAFLAWKSPSQAWQVMGASARVEAATRMERPQGQIAAMRLVLRRVRGAGGGFAAPPQGHGLGQGVELAGVGVSRWRG